MPGMYNILKAKSEALEESAKYVHCSARNLNLMLNDAIKGVPEIANFF